MAQDSHSSVGITAEANLQTRPLEDLLEERGKTDAAVDQALVDRDKATDRPGGPPKTPKTDPPPPEQGKGPQAIPGLDATPPPGKLPREVERPTTVPPEQVRPEHIDAPEIVDVPEAVVPSPEGEPGGVGPLGERLGPGERLTPGGGVLAQARARGRPRLTSWQRFKRRFRSIRSTARTALHTVVGLKIADLMRQSVGEYEKLQRVVQRVSSREGVDFGVSQREIEQVRNKFYFLRDELGATLDALHGSVSRSWVPSLGEVAAYSRLTGQTPRAVAGYLSRMAVATGGPLRRRYLQEVLQPAVMAAGERGRVGSVQRQALQVQRAMTQHSLSTPDWMGPAMVAYAARTIGQADKRRVPRASSWARTTEETVGPPAPIGEPVELTEEGEAPEATRWMERHGQMMAGLQGAVSSLGMGGGPVAAMQIAAANSLAGTGGPGSQPLSYWEATKRIQKGGPDMIQAFAKQIRRQYGTGELGLMAFQGALKQQGMNVSPEMAEDLYPAALAMDDAKVKGILDGAPKMKGAPSEGQLLAERVGAQTQASKEAVGGAVAPLYYEIRERVNALGMGLANGAPYVLAMANSMVGATESTVLAMKAFGIDAQMPKITTKGLLMEIAEGLALGPVGAVKKIAAAAQMASSFVPNPTLVPGGVVSRIKPGMLDIDQLKNAAIIEQVFRADSKYSRLGPKELDRSIAAAIANAYHESGLRARIRDGLFQTTQSGAGAGMTDSQIRDPYQNTEAILRDPANPRVIRAARAGGSVSKLAADFGQHVERSKLMILDPEKGRPKRERTARRLFSEEDFK